MNKLVYLFGLFLVLACSSDDSEVIETPENQLKFVVQKSFSINNGVEELYNTLKYEYGENNKVSRGISINDNGTFITEYQYNADNNIIKADAVEAGYFEYVYTNNLLTSTLFYSSDDDDTPDVFTYFYNQSGAVTKEERSIGGTLLCIKLFTDDGNGNYTTIENECNQSLDKLTHGTGKDPNYLLGIDPVLIASGFSYNIVDQYDLTITQGGTTIEYTNSYQHEYNEQEYPLSSLRYSDGELKERIEYSYE